MRTSRIAQDTARIAEHFTHSPPRTRTRSSRLTPAQRTPQPNGHRQGTVESDLAPSSAVTDVEDAPFTSRSTPASKRKRESSSATALTPRRSKRSAPSTPQKEDPDDFDLDFLDENSSSGFPRRPRPQPAKEVADPDSGTVMIHPPPLWNEQWDACQRMRSRHLAPVDTMGCDRLFDDQSSERDQRFQTLVALMLSPQTKDTVNAGAMLRLRKTLIPRNGFNVDAIIAMDPAEFDALIIPVGFHNTKTRNIQRAAQILRDKHDSEVPKDVNELMALPGVGPKIAYLCLQAAWQINLGIGVDVHVHRITNRWGWHKTDGPEKTREMLQSWLPRERWGPINHMLVGFGQTICKPLGPDCGQCELAEKGICPSAVLPRGKKARSLLAVLKRNLAEDGLLKKEVDEVAVKIEEAATK